MNDETPFNGTECGLCFRSLFVFGYAVILFWSIVTIIVTGVLMAHQTKDIYCSAYYEYNATIIQLLPPNNKSLCRFCFEKSCDYFWYVSFEITQYGKPINSMCSANCETSDTVKKYHFAEAYADQTNIVLYKRCDSNCYVMDNGRCCAFYYEEQH